MKQNLLRRRQRLAWPFYGWAIAVTAMVAVFSSAPGQSYGFSVFIDAILTDTGLSRTEVSALYALGTGVSAVTTMLVGRFVDRWGTRIMLALVGLAFGAACFLMASASGPWSVLLGFATLRALGQGSLAILATLLVAQWFVRYRGRAMALVQLGGAASNAIFPPAALSLSTTVGWRDAYRILGVAVWLLIIPAAVLIVRNRPEALGLHPDGVTPEPTPQIVAKAQTTLEHRRIWRTGSFWYLALPLSAAPFLITALVFHQTSIFAERGLQQSVAASTFIPLAITTALMGTFTGFLLDRVGPKRILFGTLGLLFVALIELQVLRTPLGAIIYALTLGSAAGMQGVTAGVIWAHYYGREGLGKIQGLASLITISAAALAPLPLAALQQRYNSYTWGLALYALLPWVCAIILARLRPSSGEGQKV